MRRLLTVIVMFIISRHIIYGGTVLWTGYETDYSEEYDSGLGQNVGINSFSWSLLDICDAYPNISILAVRNGRNRTVKPYQCLAAYGSNFVKVEDGEAITREATTGDSPNCFWAQMNEGGGTSSITISGTGSFILGFSTKDIQTEEYLYGWIKYIYTGDAIVVENACIAYGGDVLGIYAGSGSMIIRPRDVPEPCSVFLILLGVCACAVRRKVA